VRASLPTEEEPAPSHSIYSGEQPSSGGGDGGGGDGSGGGGGGGDGSGGGGAEAAAAEAVAAASVREAIESAEASLEQAVLTVSLTLALGSPDRKPTPDPRQS
jgi:hypothetical protein